MYFTRTSNSALDNPGLNFHAAQSRTVEQPRSGWDAEALVIRLFDQLQARIFRYVMACGLSFHDAEDIVQETFLSLFRHLERGRPQANLNGWLFRVAHNLALKRRSSNQCVERTHADQHTLARQVSVGPNAEEHVSFLQTQQRQRAVFEALADQDQRCLILRAEGLKYREIAKVLGISLGGVSSSISRSLARIGRSTGNK